MIITIVIIIIINNNIIISSRNEHRLLFNWQDKSKKIEKKIFLIPVFLEYLYEHPGIGCFIKSALFEKKNYFSQFE